jgi:predicted transposase/invertase (TIGR01784 family)
LIKNSIIFAKKNQDIKMAKIQTSKTKTARKTTKNDAPGGTMLITNNQKARNTISFDWAIKRLLRNKANYDVLEGFLSELLKRKIIIKYIGESETNKGQEAEKGNIVDILVEADNRELVLIELQYDIIMDYFHRILYSVSKAIVNHMEKNMQYDQIRKVYSVNIVHFDLGTGDDYVYHGTFSFKGMYTKNDLQLTQLQKTLYNRTIVGEIHPEYYIINVKKFENVTKNTLDEWIYYLKNNKIEDSFTAQGLEKAKEVLIYDNLTPEEKTEYDKNADRQLVREDALRTANLQGKEEGEAIGLEKGEAIGLEKGREEGEAIGLEKGEYNKAIQIAINLLKSGMSTKEVSQMTGLSEQSIINY